MIDRVYNSIKFSTNPNEPYNIDFIKRYILSGKNEQLLNNRIVVGGTPDEDGYLPQFFTPGSKFRFKRIFINRNWSIQNNELTYTNDGHKRVVVPVEEIQNKLNQLYTFSNNYIGVGLRGFYAKIAELYIGITRKQASEFLKREPLYQLTAPDNHKINKPLRPKAVMENLHVDLVDMNHYIGFNNQFRYILSCIDGFSKKIFVRAMRRKTLEETIENLESVIQEAGKTPNKIICDLGREFSLDAWGLQNGVHIVHSRSYQPQTNGQVEQSNKNIRKVLSSFFIRNGNTTWITHLDELRDNINSNRHGTTGITPNELFATNNDGVKLKGRMRINKRAVKILSKEPDFQIGDLVRIKNSALYSVIREKIKNGGKKNIVVTFSPEIFRIYQVVRIRRRNQGYENKKYLVKRLDGSLLVAENLRNPNAEPNEKQLFGNEMIKAYEEEANPIITTKQASKFNSMKAPVEPVAPAVNPPGNNPPPAPRNVVHPVTYEQRVQRERRPNPAIFNDEYET